MSLKLLFVLFAGLACGAESIPQSPCQRGSSYWCENYRQATECDALVPCTEFVWKPRIGVDPYASCQASVNAMSAYVRSSVTQQQFRESLQQLCSRLRGNQEECRSFLRNNDVFLFQLFKKHSSNLMLLCEGLVLRETSEQVDRAQENKIVSEFTRNLIQHFSSSQESLACINCQLFLTQIANMLRNGVIQEITQNVVENYCAYVEEMRQQCKALVDVYVQILFVSVIRIMSPAEKACAHFCKERAHVQLLVASYIDRQLNISEEPSTGSGIIAEDPKPLFCDVCLMTVKYWENILQLNRTLQALKLGLIKMCDALPIEYEAKCRQMAVQNGDKMINMLLLYQDPRVVCTLLFACSKEQLMIGDPDPNQSFCKTCQQITEFMTEQFQINKTQEAIEENINRVCETLPDVMKCKSIVEWNGKFLIKYIKNVVDPDVICQFLFLCGEEKETSLEEKMGENDINRLSNDELPRQLALPTVDLCPVCQKVVLMIEKFFKINETMFTIKIVVRNVCTLLAGEEEAQCVAIVNHYGNQIIQQLMYYQNPSFICKALLLCRPSADLPTVLKSKKHISCEGCTLFEKSIAEFLPTSFSKKFVQLSARRLCKNLVDVHHIQPRSLCSTSQRPSLFWEGPVCVTCKQVVAYLEGVFKVNQTMAVLTFAVVEACSILPEDQEMSCREMVAQYAANIVGLVQQQLLPLTVCKRLFFCPPSRPSSLQKLLKKDNASCDNCKQYVAYLEGVFKMNQTMEITKHVILDACSILPDEYKEKCVTTITDNANMIIELIKSKVKPDIICKLFKACAANAVDERPVKAMEPIDLCDSCTQAVAFIEGTLRINQSLAAIKEAVLYMCTILPYKQEEMCNAKIKQYADAIVGMASKGLNPVLICTTLKVCPQSRLVSAVAVKEADICISCKQAVAFVEGAFRINQTLAVAQMIAVEMCSIFPMKQEEECRKSVAVQAKGIVAMIQMRLNPHTICNVLSLCPNLRVTNTKTIVKDVTRCEICQRVVFYLENAFKLNQTMAFIRLAVVQVCVILPSDKEEKCMTNVDEYAKNTITMLQNKIKPDLLCKRLVLCSFGDRSLRVKSPTNQVVCTSCQQVVAYLEGAFKINQTLEAVKFVVVQACNIVPAERKEECEKKVLQYADTIIQMIHIKMNPADICHILFFCPPGRACESCQQAVSFVEGAFQVNQTMAALKLSVVHMCNILPLDRQEQCRTVLQQYTDNFITLIQMRMKPSAICTMLFFCGAQQRLKQLTQHNSGPDCSLCRASVNRVAQAYRVGKHEEALRNTMATICNSFPREYEVRCKNVVDNYGGIIMDKIRRSQSTAVICQTLNLCVNDVTWRRSGCRNGEQYWCGSIHNAIKCKALNYCNRIHA